MTSRPRIRYGWIAAVVIGAYLGLRVESCGKDNAPDAAARYTERHGQSMDNDHEPAGSGHFVVHTPGIVTIRMIVQGETRMLGELWISWPREEFYRPAKDIDYRASLGD